MEKTFDDCFLLIVDEENNEVKLEFENIGNENIENENSVFSCDLCDFITIDSSILNSHLSEHSYSDRKIKENKTKTKTARNYSCNKCRFKPSSFKELLKHKKNKHPGMECPICKSNYENKRELQDHAESNHKVDELFACNQCNFKTKSWLGLKSHTMVHMEIKSYKCEICGREFKHSTSLSGHRRIHKNEKKYECDACGYKSNHRRNFIEHTKFHQPEKKYTCDICGHMTKLYTSLRSHKRSHFDIRPYPCNQCDYRAKSQSNLKIHMKIHKEEFKNYYHKEKNPNSLKYIIPNN